MLAHEIKNPLTPIEVLVSSLSRSYLQKTEPEFRAHLQATGNSFLPQSAASLGEIFHTLATTSPEVLGFMQTIARKQGLELGN